MICSHCGKVLDNDKLMFCVFCGYPLKGEKKGFFAKSEETGISRAEEFAADNTPLPEVPVLGKQPQPAPPMQNVQQIPQMAGNSPVNNVQPVGMQQPMQGMPGSMPQMGAQGMVAGMPGGMNGMPQMGYGMPQMAYGMPQMQYGMPQFAGYDAAGNPLYVQMVPQLMGYDAYGNPVYNMVAMPYIMPAMQGMPGMNPMMQQQAVYPQDQVIDVSQEQLRPADAAAPQALPPIQKLPTAPVPQQAAPAVKPKPISKPAAPVAPVQPIQSVQAALQQAQDVLTAFQGVNVVQDAQPVPPSPFRSAQVNSVYDFPMDASALMSEDMPDEKALLDSIFSNKLRNFSMSEGAKPAAATFSINVAASEIKSVQHSEFGDTSAAAPPPVQSLYSMPSPSNPFADGTVNFVDPGYNPPSDSAVSDPKPAAKKPSKPRTEADANAAKRAAKEQKMKEAAAKEGKEPKNSKKKKQQKPPAKIVSPDEFFNDKPHNGSRSKTMLSVKDLDKLDDDQLAAHVSKIGGVATGGKKSNRTMKAATKEEMDISNIDPDLLIGVGKSRFPN